ncbi:MAG: hypothetical protein LV481_04805 [Methylacidiphilales bacterium]|nr:hypothetical protein [Candidatus Methylacidiphilales bacterium]
MRRGPKPSPQESTSNRQGYSTTTPTVVVENKEETFKANLITFQPSLILDDQPFIRTAALAAVLDQRMKNQRIRRRLGRWAAILGIPALVVAVLFLGPGLYRDFKAWRATTLALQGEEFVRKKQIVEAIPTIRSAFMLSPNAPEVLRVMAQILTSFNAPDAMTYWNWLLQSNDVTDDDRRAAAECAMQNDLYNRASAIISDLVVREGKDARNQLLAARWSAQRATPAQTMFFATRAVDDDPTYKPAVIFLAVQELANSRLHQEGVNSLFQLADSDNDTGLVALRDLVLDPNLKPVEVDRLIARLRSHPLAGEPERISILALEIKRHPGQRETLINQAAAARLKAPPADLATFAEWLNTHGEAARVLKLISRERALSNKSIFAAYIDALAGLNRWADLKTVLSGATVPLEAPLVELYLSHCDGEMGDDLGCNLHWQNAVSTAAYNPAQSLYLAMYAEKLGQNERAAAVYQTLTLNPVTARVAYLGLLRVLSDKDTRTLRDLLEQMVLRWPKDDEMATQYVFFNLLLNERVPEMHQSAVKLFADDSYSIAHRANVALACLRLNDPASASKAYDRVSIDWNTAPEPELVVYAATVNANGHAKRAHQLLLSVNRHALRPELRDLIKAIP